MFLREERGIILVGGGGGDGFVSPLKKHRQFGEQIGVKFEQIPVAVLIEIREFVGDPLQATLLQIIAVVEMRLDERFGDRGRIQGPNHLGLAVGLQ